MIGFGTCLTPKASLWCATARRDTPLFCGRSRCTTVDEQLDAFASAGFTDLRLEEKIEAMIFVAGRTSKLGWKQSI
jgi:hypothetical protein